MSSASKLLLRMSSRQSIFKVHAHPLYNWTPTELLEIDKGISLTLLIFLTVIFNNNNNNNNNSNSNNNTYIQYFKTVQKWNPWSRTHLSREKCYLFLLMSTFCASIQPQRSWPFMRQKVPNQRKIAKHPTNRAGFYR